MPPFRMYIVLSVLFFLVAFFDPSEKFGLFYPSAPDVPDAAQIEQQAAIDEVIKELAQSGIDGQGDSSTSSLTIGDLEISAEDQNLKTDCDIQDYDSAPVWLRSRLTKERLGQICERVKGDGGKSLIAGLLDNVPAFLFLFLPLLALVMKVLYPLSKRYYVEHLLFVVHLHAFFFLLLTMQILFSRTMTFFNISGIGSGIVTAAVSIYIPVYLYKGMREVYDQGRWVTIGKFMVLSMAYAIGFAMMLSIALLFTAVSM